MKKITLGILGILTGISIVLLLFMLFIYQHLEDANLGYPIPEKMIKVRELSTPFSMPAWKAEGDETVTDVTGEAVSLVLGGDVNIDGFQNGYKSKGISHMLSETYLKIMTEADFTMVNQEFPFSTRGEPADKTYTYCEDPSLVTVLSDMGVDMVSLANNHALDYGRDALEDTFATLRQAKIPYGGAGVNYEEAKTLRTFDLKGKKLGILCASRVIPVSDWNATVNSSGLFTTYDPVGLLREIAAAKTQCDLVLVYVHWGVERQEFPEDYQKKLAKQYIDGGADMVIGSHPHVWQGIEFYKGKPIAYSLGNLIFNNTKETALLQLDMNEENQISLRIFPMERSGYQLVAHSNSQKFLEHIQNISFGITIDENGKVVEVAKDEEE